MSNDNRKNGPSIRKNYVYNTIYQVFTVIIPFITAPYISRVLGAEKIGIQSFTSSIVAYFTLFAAMGTASYGQREIAMNRDDIKKRSVLFWEIEIVSIFTTLIATIAWIIWILVSKQYASYYMILTLNIIAVAFDITWFFSGLEQFKLIVVRNIVFRLIGVLLLFICIHKPSDLLLYMGISSVSGLVGTISLWGYLKKLAVKVRFKELKPFHHLKYIIGYFIPTIATSIYTVLDKTMIGLITKSEIENGYYEQAMKIVRMVQSILFSLNTVMTSRMSYLFSEKRIDEIKDKINKSFDFIFLLAVPFVLGLIGISPNFVPWFFGDGYEGVTLLISILAPLPLVISISNILGSQYLTPSGQRVRSSKGIIAGACVNLICNVLLIPKLGSVGAAIGSIIAEGTISLIYVYMSRGYTSWKRIWSLIWKKLLAGVVMLIIVIIIGQGKEGSVLTTILQVITGALVYLLCLVIGKDSFLEKYIIEIKTRVKNNG